MKKMYLWLLVLGLSLGVASCYEEPDDDSSSDDDDDDDDNDNNNDDDNDDNDDNDDVSGGAVGKFCNGLAQGEDDVILCAAIINENEDVGALCANTGTCSTPLGASCNAIPSGDLQIVLVDAEANPISNVYTLDDIDDGAELFFQSKMIDDEPGMEGGELNPGFDCEDQDFSKLIQQLVQEIELLRK